MKQWKNQRWLWTLILLGMFVLLSAVKLVVLPQGGSVTYLSLLILWLVPFFFGFRYGLLWTVLFGLTKLGVNYITGEYINYHPLALLLEYPLGCGVFCLGCLLKRKEGTCVNNFEKEDREEEFERFKLRMGYAIGVFGQFVLYVISAVCFYPPDRVGFWNNLLFCILYDGSYLLTEGAVTLLFLCVPSVQDAICYLKHVATDKEDDSLDFF